MGSPNGPDEDAADRDTANGNAQAAGGRALFLASGCAGCHTLAAAGATGDSGPNLDRARPGYARVVEQVTDGGGGMPAYGGSLTPAQIAAIARYVSASTR